MSIEAMKLALFALDIVKIHYTQNRHINEAIAALKERLADPMREVQRLGQEIEQEPTAKYSDIISDGGLDPRNKFDVSPQRTWANLSDEDIVDALQPLYQTRALAELAAELFMDEFQAVICKFMEKNT
jgi:hypothetical protein